MEFSGLYEDGGLAAGARERLWEFRSEEGLDLPGDSCRAAEETRRGGDQGRGDRHGVQGEGLKAEVGRLKDRLLAWG